ncbi:hypothetical protein FBQ97_12750 [Acidobacteria bacterium ACD]|nr:MAG: hypothetical protein EDX89_24255 [Acidobacteriota bacterium]MDL1950665.1 hypothetical protein [Acidobacteria bacterium ACD]
MGVSIETELKALERHVLDLRIQYERFFAGDSKLPPVKDRRQLESFLRRVSNQEIDKAAERFRLQTLQSRYNSLCELWDKRLRAREEGRPWGGVHQVSGAAAAPAPAASGTPGRDAGASGAVKPGARVDFTPLFEKYKAARAALGEDVSKLNYTRFEELVRRQADEIRQRTGATRLTFEVRSADGKVRLVGRPSAPKGSQ